MTVSIVSLVLLLVLARESFGLLRPQAFSAVRLTAGLEHSSSTLQHQIKDSARRFLEPGEKIQQPICRIVTRADSKLPTSPKYLPSTLFQSPIVLGKLDAYYTARAHQRNKALRYLQKDKKSQAKTRILDSNSGSKNETAVSDADIAQHEADDTQLIGTLRENLEDAGFALLNRRDIDLCDSLNVGYLLRLSIVPDTSELDPLISQEFYPEAFHENGTAIDKDELLFDGRVMVFWRGYSQEVTQGRLILPKLDYLQASLVQRSAAWLKNRLDSVESKVSKNVIRQIQRLRSKLSGAVDSVADSLPMTKAAEGLRNVFDSDGSDMGTILLPPEEGSFKLGRYGGSKVRFVGSPNPSDALDAFTICEIPDDESVSIDSSNSTEVLTERHMKEEINYEGYTCLYDQEMMKVNGVENERMELLERVGISNLVDLFTQSGRRKWIQAIFEPSELVEPTYQEVVVVWRPKKKKRTKIAPPKAVSDLADMLDVEGFEQPKKDTSQKLREELQIRNFEGVPMSNLPAVLPKTKLIFRPADAFLFDMISFLTFLLVVGSIRLDSPRLDLLALVSVTLWIIRTIFRYSNKLARYDLLVKTFLTSKISHRNAGAVKYIGAEAASQKALRASLLHAWLSKAWKRRQFEAGGKLTKSLIEQKAQNEINGMINSDTQVRLKIDRAMYDVEELDLVQFDKESGNVAQVLDSKAASISLASSWRSLFESLDPGNDDGDDDDSSGPMVTTTEAESRYSSVELENEDEAGLPLGIFEERRKQYAARLAGA